MDVLFHHAIESHARCTPFLFFRLYAAGIAKCPHHVPLYQAWAILELRFGNVLTAKRLIGEALTRDKRNGSGWLIAANIEEKMSIFETTGLCTYTSNVAGGYFSLPTTDSYGLVCSPYRLGSLSYKNVYNTSIGPLEELQRSEFYYIQNSLRSQIQS